MNSPRQWEIWYADFAFEDKPGSKDRPVLVIEAGDICYVVSMITSHPQRDAWGDYDITSWQTAGLEHPSTVRLSRITELRSSDFRKKIGDLPLSDIERIRKILAI